VEDSDASVGAHLRLGHCYRYLNRLDEAGGAFTAASDVATAAGDMIGVLRARVGEGRIAILRGNLPRAEVLLDDTIRRATGAAFADVRSRALHERSNVAFYRDQFELAIQFAYRALEDSQSPSERDRILGDIAVSFLELGVYSAARDAYLVLSLTAQEQYVRWAATLNLLEIAVQTGAEMLFESYRRQLGSAALPAHMATAFHLNVGAGHQRFGDSERARASFEQALALAAEHGFNQFIFRAEAAIDGLATVQTASPPAPSSATISLDVEEVANALRQMRETAGAV
jgi:tetratricopeptide (TPR) repeat protein